MKTIVKLFSSNIITLFSGIFLIASFLLKKVFDYNIPIYLDPAWLSVAISGTPLIISAIKKIIYNKGISKISSALLVSVAMISAIYINDLFAAGEIAFIMALGEILEDKTTAKAKKGLKNLIQLSPKTCRKVTNEKEEIVSIDEIRENDIIRILPGEIIPTDGRIISGETSIDQSVITGESMPIDKTIDNEVFGGTTNLYGSVDIIITKAGKDSSLNRLISLVENAENNKAPIQRIADKWASYLVPIAMMIAIISGLIKSNIVVAVTILVVFCPCALVLATPTAIMAAIGQATKHGVIIKSGEAIEALNNIDTIAFDKTGTLTYGKIKINKVVPFSEAITTNDLLSLASSAESKSEHPIGAAILSYAKENNILLYQANNFKSIWGKGVSANINGHFVLCGNEKLMKDNNIEISQKNENYLEEAKNNGITFVIIAVDNCAMGAIFISDEIKPETKQTIKDLNTSNIDTILLTGDNSKTANHITNAIEINKVYADLLPENKLEIIENLKSNGKKVCMVGDGVNDAPALKTANIGIAMATIGSDISVEAADIAILGDDISKIYYLKKLSNATVKTIKLSITLSLAINFIAIILSIFEILNPTAGALVHNLGSFFVILISAKLYDKKIK